MDCWKLRQYAREAPVYTGSVIISSPGIQYLTAVKIQIQATWILPSLKKCLRDLKMIFTDAGIYADIGTCSVHCDQWTCPKKPNGSLAEFGATEQAIIYEWFHLGWKDEILTVLKSAGILVCPAMEAGSHLMLTESHGSSITDTSGFLLVSALMFSMKW